MPRTIWNTYTKLHQPTAMKTLKKIGKTQKNLKLWGRGGIFFLSNFSVKTKTSQCWGHKEYVYQVSLTYDDGNVDKNRGNPKTILSLGGGGFFLSNFSVKTKTAQCLGYKEYVYQLLLTYDDGNIEKNRGKRVGGSSSRRSSRTGARPQNRNFQRTTIS